MGDMGEGCRMGTEWGGDGEGVGGMLRKFCGSHSGGGRPAV